MCLAECAATYVVNYECNDCDALPAPESDVTRLKTSVQRLKDVLLCLIHLHQWLKYAKGTFLLIQPNLLVGLCVCFERGVSSEISVL